MYGNFTAPPTRSPEASSAPLNIFRNRERYHLECYDTKITAGINALRADAWTKTLYAKDRLLEDPIPSFLIHDNLMQSHLLSQSRNTIKDPREISLPAFRHSTFSACHHEHRSLYVHAGGKGMDELILRDVVSLCTTFEHDDTKNLYDNHHQLRNHHHSTFLRDIFHNMLEGNFCQSLDLHFLSVEDHQLYQ
jgi:hypothetical protein